MEAQAATLHNAFHFDDDHTIQNNLYIRDLRNIPLFFKTPKTFSSLPARARRVKIGVPL